jgi:uncharacterized Fe-S cluster protein YjdI
MARKTYTGKAASITFDLEACIHAGACVRGLPQVFDLKRKPWILPDAGSVAELRDIVARCPSGALGIMEAEGASAAPSGVQVQTGRGGPYIIKGGCQVLGADGSVLKEGAVVALCACGKTAKAPFCDGSHAASE